MRDCNLNKEISFHQGVIFAVCELTHYMSPSVHTLRACPPHVLGIHMLAKTPSPCITNERIKLLYETLVDDFRSGSKKDGNSRRSRLGIVIRSACVRRRQGLNRNENPLCKVNRTSMMCGLLELMLCAVGIRKSIS